MASLNAEICACATRNGTASAFAGMFRTVTAATATAVATAHLLWRILGRVIRVLLSLGDGRKGYACDAMNLSELLTRWFDVRPGEARKVLLSFLGAYCVISFLILAKSLREAFYLSVFDVTTLPYVIVGAAVLSFPSAVLFGRLMAAGNPRRVYISYLVAFAAAVAVLWLFTEPAPEVTIVVFYLVTLLGSSLLTTGFWMVTSEQFSIRQAKRVFGLVGAGGTLGAMITGVSLGRLTGRFGTVELVFGLILLLAATLVLQLSMPKLASHHHHEGQRSTSIREGLSLIFERPHLRNIAVIVMVATMASTILDYQFKEIVTNHFRDAGTGLISSEDMASFFGAFYGWTGVISLLVQVFVVSRLMSSAGIAVSLSVLPTLLFAGSAAILIAPTFLVATLARGADNSLRKSLHRSVLEYLYVPVAPHIRRKTKAFIDSVVDSAAAGLAAGVLFLWVTLAGWPSRYLSLWVMALAVMFIYVGLKTGAEYTRTVRDRLADDGEDVDTSDFDARNLLTVTLTRMDLQVELAKAGIDIGDGDVAKRSKAVADDTGSIADRIVSSDNAVVEHALGEFDEWDASHVEALTRLLARSLFYSRAVNALLKIGDPALDHLVETLLDENADFVIRRRIPRILSESDTPQAHQALLDALAAGRFEVRYRGAVALARRRDQGLAEAPGDWRAIVWRAVEREVGRDRPIWELQKILDGSEAGEDDFVGQRVEVRGELSLEHTFRLLSLVLDPGAVKMAFHGIILDDENLKSLSLEYLEQTLPPAIRERLWPFIGDISDYQRRRSMRSVDEVVDDLSQTGVTLFGGEGARAALDEALREHDRSSKKDKADD